jgi:ElaB/YqjD/DUF883 family membrane-anchored ribosome-binding protein
MSGDNSEGPVYSTTYGDAASKAQTAPGNAKDAVNEGVDAASAQVSAGRDWVAGAMGSAADNLSRSAANAEDQFAAVASDLESRIKKNPLAPVAIAGLIGLLIGKMSKTMNWWLTRAGGFTLGLAFDGDRALFFCDNRDKTVYRLDLTSRGVARCAPPGIRIPNYPVVDGRRRRLLVSDSYDFASPGPGVWAYDLATGERGL